MKTALILPPTESSFRPVAGVPLIQRTLLSAQRCGFDRIVVLDPGAANGALAGQQYTDALRRLLASDKRIASVEVADNLACIGTPNTDGAAIAVIASDHVVTADTLERVGSARLDGRPMLFSGDGNSGVALCRPTMLEGLDIGGLAAGGADVLWAALRQRGAETVLLNGALCARISDARSVTAAEAALCAGLRAESARSDGPLAHWIDRRLSLRISRWLVNHTALRPNHITVIGTCAGMFAAWLLSVGTYWTGVAGTVLFLCTTIIDGCDGEVARLKFQESSFGQKFDVITDNIVHVAIFVGLALGLYHRDPHGHYVALIGILLGGFVCTLAVSYFFLVRRPGFAESGGAPITLKGKLRRGLLRGLEAMMNRDFAYLLIAFAVADRLAWFVWGAAFGTYAFAIALVCIYRWRDAH